LDKNPQSYTYLIFEKSAKNYNGTNIDRLFKKCCQSCGAITSFMYYFNLPQS
jgi:hypothetical protein